MDCQRCSSSRVLNVNGKSGEQTVLNLNNEEYLGSPVEPLGSGDYIKFSVCLNCGQQQGSFPVEPIEELKETEENINILEFTNAYSSNHRDEIIDSKNCGCFHCLETFHPQAIEFWIDFIPGKDPSNGRTAVCPFCSVESVLGDASPIPELTKSFLIEMNERWFNID